MKGWSDFFRKHHYPFDLQVGPLLGTQGGRGGGGGGGGGGGANASNGIYKITGMIFTNFCWKEPWMSIPRLC